MMLLAFTLTLAGAGLLCFSMRRHFKQAFSTRQYSATYAYLARALGYLLLVVAASVCSLIEGAGVGIVVFLGLLTVAVFGIATSLPFLQRFL